MSLVRVSNIAQKCTGHPTQWEGSMDDGQHIYVRYRWGCLSIGTGKTIEEAVRNSNNLFEKQLGDKRDGKLEYAQLREATKGLVDWPELSETRG